MEARGKARGRRPPHENCRPHCSVAQDFRLQASQGEKKHQRRSRRGRHQPAEPPCIAQTSPSAPRAGLP